MNFLFANFWYFVAVVVPYHCAKNWSLRLITEFFWSFTFFGRSFFGLIFRLVTESVIRTPLHINGADPYWCGWYLVLTTARRAPQDLGFWRICHQTVGPHPRQHSRLHRRQTFCRSGRRRHMVDRSRRSACRLRTREELAGGVLSTAGDGRRTAENGSDQRPILWNPMHDWQWQRGGSTCTDELRAAGQVRREPLKDNAIETV